MMPSVLPRTSWQPEAVFCQLPVCISRLRSPMRRARKTISAITSSATLRVFENGALKTGTPLAPATSSATWLVPMQKQPMARSAPAASSTGAVMCVLLRSPTATQSWISRIRSSSPSALLSRSTS